MKKTANIAFFIYKSNTHFHLDTADNWILYNMFWVFPTLWGQNGIRKSKSFSNNISYLSADLVTALAGLNVDNFPHDECLSVTITGRSVC